MTVAAFILAWPALGRQGLAPFGPPRQHHRCDASGDCHRYRDVRPEILDRAYGKAMQPIQGTVDYGISEQLAELFRGNAGNTLGAEIARRAALPPPKPH